MYLANIPISIKALPEPHKYHDITWTDLHLLQSCRTEDYIRDENILVHVYIVDEKGRVDISLTIDLSAVIKKGFESSTSHFKDKVSI